MRLDSEIFISDAQAPDLFMALIESGRAHGIQPVGLGARDTLRMEKGYLLSGVDFLTASLLPDDGSKDHLLRTTVETNVPFGLDLVASSWVDRGTSSATKVPFGGGVSVRWDVVPHPERGRRSTHTTVAWRQIPRGSNRSRSSPQELLHRRLGTSVSGWAISRHGAW